jgi:hypothetical protein
MEQERTNLDLGYMSNAMKSMLSTKSIVVKIATISIATPVIMLFLVSPSQSTPVRDRSTTDITTKLYPCGHFMGNKWSLEVGKNERGYTYFMQNSRSSTNLDLAGGRLTKANGTHYYKWNNRGTIYQVIWKPRDSEYARVQAFDGGKQVVNQLLKLDYSPCD